VPVPWRECLPKGILESEEPRVAEYLKAWERADARDEAYVRGGLVDVVAPGDVKKEEKEAWERRAEAAGHRARCHTLGLSSEWSQSESSSSSSSSSSDDDDE
jgi:hypothetical protein